MEGTDLSGNDGILPAALEQNSIIYHYEEEQEISVSIAGTNQSAVGNTSISMCKDDNPDNLIISIASEGDEHKLLGFCPKEVDEEDSTLVSIVAAEINDLSISMYKERRDTKYRQPTKYSNQDEFDEEGTSFGENDWNSVSMIQPADSGIDELLDISVDSKLDDAMYTERISSEVTDIIKKKKPKDARQFLSLMCGMMTRKEAEKMVGRKISKREWTEAVKHRIYPGPGEVLERELFIAHRQRIEENTLVDFIEWLKADGHLQNLSFGQKIVRYFNGRFVPIESVKRTNACLQIIRGYYQSFLEEAEADMDILDNSDHGNDDEVPELLERGYDSDSDDDDDDDNDDDDEGDDHGNNNNNNNIDTNANADDNNNGSNENNDKDENNDTGNRKLRCKAKNKFGLRCYKEKCHDGQHKFTPDTLLSPSSIYRLLSELTSGEIQSRAGLDNTDVSKGHDNFETMRGLVNTFGSLTQGFQKERVEALLLRIDEAEEFHKVNYERHLGEGNFQCACFHCGFKDDKKDPIQCPSKGQHNPPCKQCQDSIEVIMDLYEFHSEVDAKLKEDGTYAKRPELEDDILTWKDEINHCFENLLEYRAHIVHKVSESIFDKGFYSYLKVGQAVIVVDYKMKINPAKYREPQKDWFSKRGTSVLGVEVHVMTEEGIKVIYHFFISDDSTQDAHAVLCAKHFLYQVVLPAYDVTEVLFRSDGAGCYSSAAAKSSMQMWHDIYARTDKNCCYETTYKVTVAGCGKTALDGLFGVLTMHLLRLVNYGHSYQGAKEIFDLLRLYPLQSCVFHYFNPKRDILQFPEPKQGSNLAQFYLLQFDHEKGKAFAKWHSEIGTKVAFDVNGIEGLRKRTNGSKQQVKPTLAEVTKAEKIGTENGEK